MIEFCLLPFLILVDKLLNLKLTIGTVQGVSFLNCLLRNDWFFFLFLTLHFKFFALNFKWSPQVKWLIDIHWPLYHSDCLLRRKWSFANSRIYTLVPLPAVLPMRPDPMLLLHFVYDPFLGLLLIPPLLCLFEYLLASRVHIGFLT